MLSLSAVHAAIMTGGGGGGGGGIAGEVGGVAPAGVGAS